MEEDHMKKSIIAIVLVLAFACLIFGQAKKQTQATSAEQELMQMEKDLINAYLKQDVASLDRLLADDYIGTDSDGSLSTKAESISNAKSGTDPVTSVVVNDMKTHVWGDAGVVWSRSADKFQTKGNETSGQYQHTTTWVKIAGRWQTVAANSSRVVKK
jgi:hypothetical protein